ncbi:MAG: hypothetical protein IT427_07900 [Pirellulales bacterium]|nr:hypothetical protein [Pirellulales bacterium]
MIRSNRILFIAFATIALCLSAATTTFADPLPGRDILKFEQLPLDNVTYPVADPATGQTVDMTYWGHNELSTAYGRPNPSGGLPVYVGTFMADDFADKFSSPIVHVKWWGSYPTYNPDFPVNRFLISFETDVPAQPGSFSHPGQPLLNQIVERGPLSIGSGTFTETPFSPGGPPLNEQVFQYNAELALNLPFPQQPDTVYWLKIVALVDDPTGVVTDPIHPPTNITQWGWHDRDYTKTNGLASTPPLVNPGEYLDFFVPNTPGVRGYHFQDDAVTGTVSVDFNPVTPGALFPTVVQDPFAMTPTNYLDTIDGPPGISQYSKDLAFALYTVPEPMGCWIFATGIAMFCWRAKSWTAKV